MDDPRASLRLPDDHLVNVALAKRKDAKGGQEEQSYWGHVTDVYVAWLGLIKVHEDLIARVAAKYGLTVDRVLQSSLLCVALHDVGKLSANFQNMMGAEDEAAYKAAVGLNYRHEVAALWLVSKAAESLMTHAGIFPGGGLLETLAVAGHHKYLADEHLFLRNRFSNTLAWKGGTIPAVKAAMRLAAEMFRHQGWEPPNPRFTPRDLEVKLNYRGEGHRNEPYEWLMKSKEDISCLGEARIGRLRDLFMLLKGLLMTADWMASGAKGREEALDASRGVVRVGPGPLRKHVGVRVERRR
ncbi:CRISPR-associated endonuclease Cas3'', partial [Singulisphaera rosea]